MIRILQSSWFISLTGCLIYLATTGMLIKPEQFEAAIPVATNEVARSADSDPSWKFRNPEFDQWVSELKHEKESLDLREQQLKELQSRLEGQRQEISGITQAVHLLQTDFDRNVVRIKEQEVVNLKREVKLLSSMSPEAAAGTLNEMADDDVVRVLYLMKVDQAALILDTFTKLGKSQAKRVAVITERMRHTLPPPAPANSSSTF